MTTTKKTEQQELEDAFETALNENRELKEEGRRDKAHIANLSRRVGPMSMLATLVTGDAQLPWEDESALRAEISKVLVEKILANLKGDMPEVVSLLERLVGLLSSDADEFLLLEERRKHREQLEQIRDGKISASAILAQLETTSSGEDLLNK